MDSKKKKIRKPVKVRGKVCIPIFIDSMKETVKGVLTSFTNLSDSLEHVAIKLGRVKKGETPLIRVHSECLTGEVFGSQLCDCRLQLQEAIRLIYINGGYLIYLRQEGRGIGLYSKIDAYRLQKKGLNTYEANRHLGFSGDLRSFKSAVEILFALKLHSIKLLTNNPDKLNQLRKNGIRVIEQVKTSCFINEYNRNYMETKKRIGLHKLEL